VKPLLAFAALAMLAWPAAARPPRALTLATCQGGAVRIPMKGDGKPTGCHAAVCQRKRSI
jgi:hypothetical protein